MNSLPGLEGWLDAQGIFSLSEKDFTALATLIAFGMMNHLSVAQQNSLGNFFITIGQILATSSSQLALLYEAAQPSSCELQAQIDALQQQLNRLEREGS